MSVNETTTTAAIFLGCVLVVLLVGLVLAVQRGDTAWPPGSEERVEPAKPPAYANIRQRPTFSRSLYAELKTDKKEEVVEQESAELHMPAIDTVGFGLSAVGIVWLLVEAFSQATVWGCAVLFGNLLGAVAFLFAYPKRAWRPFSVQCAR